MLEQYINPREYFRPPVLEGDFLSGFRILESGDESLKARLAFIRSAQHTLDLQYYAVNNDLTSNLLIEAILAAADRGVTVRFLLDDISLGKARRNLRSLDMVDNIQIRIFNPLTKGDQSAISRLIGFFSNLRRNTRRMHNKSLIADNYMAITGGRNLGDEYFDAHADMSFKDVDALMVGSIANQLTETFDIFWKSENVYRISALHRERKSPKLIKSLREKLQNHRKDRLLKKFNTEGLSFSLNEYFEDMRSHLVWAEAEFISDKPDKATANKNIQSEPMERIRALANDARKNILMVSPYFVPRPAETKWFGALKQRGLSIRIITNSLSSTDVVAVHTGYRQARLPIVQDGIEIFELKAIDNKSPKQRIIGRGTPSSASLHAKVYVFDEETTVIGSLNFDPRSEDLNTEGVLFIRDKKISAQMIELYKKVSSPKSSYKLLLDPKKKNAIVWQSEEKGKITLFHHEPRASLWRRLQLFLFDFLPVEDQL